MTDLPSLRRELLILLADTNSDLEPIREKVGAIIGEIERLARPADDAPPEHPD
jgi:hypothetical protein